MLEIQTFYFLGELFLPEIHPFYRFTLPPFSVSIRPRRGRDALAPEKAKVFQLAKSMPYSGNGRGRSRKNAL
jgi:hypothetical protein